MKARNGDVRVEADGAQVSAVGGVQVVSGVGGEIVPALAVGDGFAAFLADEGVLGDFRP